MPPSFPSWLRRTSLTLSLWAAAAPMALAASVASPHLNQPELLRSAVLEWADWWLAHGYDPVTGRCWAHLDRQGVVKDVREGSLTQSRNAYAMTRAFLLSGDEKYLVAARQMIAYQEQRFWDPVAGGWWQFTYTTSNPKKGIVAGTVDQTPVRGAFHQHYCLLGTGAYLEATRDPQVLELHQRGRDLNEARMWDGRHGFEGYFQNWYTDGRASDGKGFTPTMDGITTHHLTDVLVLGDDLAQQRLRQLAEQTAHIEASMDDPVTAFGFVSNYDADWNMTMPTDVLKRTVSIGHVLKTGWVLSRSYMLYRDPAFRARARRMLDEVWLYDASGPNAAWDHVRGGPYERMNYSTGVRQSGSTTVDDSAWKWWWSVEQGVTGGLTLWHITHDDRYLTMADQSLTCFFRDFVDHEYGDTFDAVQASDGTPTKTDKASDYRGAYHSTELAYLGYLYGNLYLHGGDVTLHYRFDPQAQERDLVLNPVEILAESGLTIRSVQRDGAAYAAFDATSRTLHLPAGVGGTFAVTYGVTHTTEALHRPVVAMADASAAVPEGGTVSVAVRRATRLGDAVGAATVAWSLASGTATVGADAPVAGGTLTWTADGPSEQTIAIAVSQDATYEGPETLVLTLVDAGAGAELGATVATTITIADDDPQPVTITLSDVERIYTGVAQGVTVTAEPIAPVTIVYQPYSADPGVGGTPVGDPIAAPVHAGWYAVHAAASAAFIGTADGWLHIAPAPLTLTIADAAMAVGGALPTFTWTATGLVGADAAAMVVTGTPTSAADGGLPGRFAITAGSLAVMAGDYALAAIVAGQLTVGDPETQGPTVALEGPNRAMVGQAFTLTVRFSEAVSGCSVDDLVLAGAATVAEWQTMDAAQYRCRVMPDAVGTLTVSLAVGAGADVWGNTSLAAPNLVVQVSPPPEAGGAGGGGGSDGGCGAGAALAILAALGLRRRVHRPDVV